MEAARPSPRSEPASVHELFESQARRTPDRIAVVFEGRELSYAELDRRADRVARHLRAHGVERGMLVGVLLDRSPEMIAGLLGVLKAGAAYVPIDPEYPRERIAFMLSDADAPIVLSRGGGKAFGAPERQVISIDAIVEEREPERHRAAVAPTDLAYVIYTSGSTGQPKGVAIEHRSVANLLRSMQREPGLAQDDVLLALTSVSFDIAALELFLPLVTGARLVIASAATSRHPASIIDAIERSHATTIQATPTLLQMLLSAGWRGRPGLRIFCGGEPLPARLAAQLLERGAALFNLYGPTETTIWSTFAAITSADQVTVGRPIADTHVYVVPEGAPGDALKRVPPGAIGELCIGGAGVARGYWKRPELTRERFVPDPFRADGSRLYRTGDLARQRPDGRLELLGRVDRQVKIRGVRVELPEIEAVLAGHPLVDGCAVLARPGPHDTARLVAYVVRAARPVPERGPEAVSKWRKVWSEVYRQASETDDGSWSTAGWNDSVTGLPLARDEVVEWADRTADRILALHPKRVLEVGCGNGLILRRIAPRVTSYLGLDITEEAVARVHSDLKREPVGGGATVDVQCGSADDVDTQPDGQHDCIVLNSVMQYFPNVEYAVAVLEAALRRVAPGGTIFVGDVRTLPLLEAFHLSVEMARSPDSLASEELHRRVREGMHREKELVLEPALFEAFAKSHREVAAVEIRPKRGRHPNELTRFRYDVVLRRAPHVPAPSPAIERVPWDTGLSPDRLPEWLAQQRVDALTLAGVPNARVARDLAALDALTSTHPPATVGTLREVAEAAARDAIDPEGLCSVAESNGWEPVLEWAADPAAVDVTLVRRVRGASSGGPSRTVDRPSTRRLAEIADEARGRPGVPWTAMANDPSRASSAESLTRTLRGFLRQQLPDAMIPSHFVPIEALPRTPAGKLDLAALATLDVAPSRSDSLAVAPSDALESLLVEIWEDVLAVDGIGVTDDFGDLGGDSLLAVEIMARVEKALRGKVSTASVFGTHRLTVAKQAAILRARGKTPLDHVSVVGLQPSGTRAPLFFASTPMNLVRHFDPDQPLYDVSIPVVHGRTYEIDRIDHTVQECVDAIQRIEPRGPYLLGGACFPGLLMLETAERLHAAGHEVALLVLIDPDPEEDVPLAQRVLQHLRELTHLTGAQRSALLRKKRGSLLRAANLVVEGTSKRDLDYDALYEARWGGTRWSYPFPLSLFLTTPRYRARRDALALWQQRANRSLTVTTLPGDRSTVFGEPNARVVAERIAESVREAHTKLARTE